MTQLGLHLEQNWWLLYGDYFDFDSVKQQFFLRFSFSSAIVVHNVHRMEKKRKKNTRIQGYPGIGMNASPLALCRSRLTMMETKVLCLLYNAHSLYLSSFSSRN